MANYLLVLVLFSVYTPNSNTDCSTVYCIEMHGACAIAHANATF
jgi:hypothetical protein